MAVWRVGWWVEVTVGERVDQMAASTAGNSEN